jgi:dihydroorotate dehydrogenase electron transfer subunit
MTPVLIAGGSGFPPLHFFSIKSGSNAHFFVGARNRDCLPPVSVLKNIRSHTAGVHIATDDGSFGHKGTSSELLNSFLTKMERKTHLLLYACGPHAMQAAVSMIAAEHSLPCYVSMEERMACGLGACMGCSVGMKSGGYKRVCKEGPVFDSRDIDWTERILLPIPHAKR